MSVEQYGSNLLHDLHEEGLDQLLADVRHRTNPQSKRILGISTIDDLLQTLHDSQEPFTTAHRSGWPSSGFPSPDQALWGENEHHDSYEHGDLTFDVSLAQAESTRQKPTTIEITSQNSSSGKTNLLYYLVMLSVLSLDHDGKQSVVVWIDNDGRFSASRLLHVIHNHLRQQPTTSLSEADIQSVAHEALTHVHVFRPQSSAHVLSTLRRLPDYLLDRTRHKSSLRPLGLVVIDSATAFRWQDRFDADMAKLDVPEQNDWNDIASRTAEIITELRTIQVNFECIVLFTTTSSADIAYGRSPQYTLSSRPSIPPPAENVKTITPWSAFATVTFQLNWTNVPQFAPQLSYDSCLHDAESRLEIVRKGRLMLTVQVSRYGRTKGHTVPVRLMADGMVVID